MAPLPPTLSLFQTLDLTIRIIILALWQIPRAILAGRARGTKPHILISNTIFRLVVGNIPPLYIQSIGDTTVGRYKKWLEAKKAKLSTEDPQLASRLHEDIEGIPGTNGCIAWIGDRRKASKYVVLFHGGGYISAAVPGHFEWVWNSFVAGGSGVTEDVAVAVIQYTLAPEARYPRQLIEACAGLRMLLERGISPSDVIFGGDSAGGNLTAQVLRHLVEPHPCIEPIHLKGPVAGAFMVSPLVDCRPNTPSFRDNAAVDMISTKLCLDVARVLFRAQPGGMSIQKQRAMALPMEGDPEWMKRIDSVTKKLYVTAGRQEVFADHIRQFAELVSRQCPALLLRYEMSETESHVAIVLEGFGAPGDATRRMQEWAREAI